MAALIPALIKLLISRRGGGGGGGGGRPKKTDWDYALDRIGKEITAGIGEFSDVTDAGNDALKSLTGATNASAERIRRLRGGGSK